MDIRWKHPESGSNVRAKGSFNGDGGSPSTQSRSGMVSSSVQFLHGFWRSCIVRGYVTTKTYVLVLPNVGSWNDIWRYSFDTGQWAWMSGNNTFSPRGVYNATSGNFPSGRRRHAAVYHPGMDAVFTFGGYGRGATDVEGAFVTVSGFV